MSRNALDFYARRHQVGETYSGGQYHITDLIRSPVLRSWAAGRSPESYGALDIGCGKGHFLKQFWMGLDADYGLNPGRLVGMDLVASPDNCFEEMPACFEFRQGDVDGTSLPFDDQAFDIVTCNHVLEHVFETERLVEEIRRVMKVDGVAVMSVPNIAAWINRGLFLFGVQPLGSELGTRSITYGFRPSVAKSRLRPYTPSGHIRDFTPNGLKDLVESCGFRVGGWWNQDGTRLGRVFKRSARNMGVVLTRTP